MLYINIKLYMVCYYLTLFDKGSNIHIFVYALLFGIYNCFNCFNSFLWLNLSIFAICDCSFPSYSTDYSQSCIVSCAVSFHILSVTLGIYRVHLRGKHWLLSIMHCAHLFQQLWFFLGFYLSICSEKTNIILSEIFL